MKIGYARVSTKDQNIDLQKDALLKVGCEMIFMEKASRAKADRIELEKLLGQVRKDDVVVVYKLDRVGRSLKHLLEIVAQLNEKKVLAMLSTRQRHKVAYFLIFRLLC